MYLLGEYVIGDYPAMQLTTDLFKYDLKANTWSVVPAKNHSLNAVEFGMMVFQGVLYRFRGYNTVLREDYFTFYKLDLKADNPEWLAVSFGKAEEANDQYAVPSENYAFDFYDSQAWFVSGGGDARLRNNVLKVDLCKE